MSDPGGMFSDAGFQLPGKKATAPAPAPTTAEGGSLFRDAGFRSLKMPVHRKNRLVSSAMKFRFMPLTRQNIKKQSKNMASTIPRMPIH